MRLNVLLVILSLMVSYEYLWLILRFKVFFTLVSGAGFWSRVSVPSHCMYVTFNRFCQFVTSFLCLLKLIQFHYDNFAHVSFDLYSRFTQSSIMLQHSNKRLFKNLKHHWINIFS